MQVVQAFPVEKEYEKNPDISPEDIRKLREWLKTQPHLPEKYITDLDLILLFFCCEKSAEVSKQVLDLHYTLRTHLNEWFLNRTVDKKMLQCINTILIAPLPTFTADGYKVIYCRLLDGDPKRYFFIDIVRLFGMVFDLYQYAEGTWPGLVLVIDMDLVCLGHLGRIDLSTLRQVVVFHQECMYVKLKEVHFINAPHYMDRFLALLRPFAKKSFLDMIKIHERGSDSMYKSVPKSAFPKESGGNFKDNITLRDEIHRHLEDNKKFFEEEGRKLVNESLRPDGKTNVKDIFGIQGSFKKLEID